MRTQLSLAVIAAALLGGCGGGGNDDHYVTPPTPPPITEAIPDSASQNSNGFIAYLLALVNSSADQLEPVKTDGFTAPTAEQEEPISI